MIKSSIIFILTIVWATACFGKSIYSNSSNGFATLLTNKTFPLEVNVNVNDKTLEIQNKGDKDYILTDNSMLPSCYRYTVRFANATNKPGKKSTINSNGQNKKISGSSWGLAFNIQPNSDMMYVELKCDNDDLHNDIGTQRKLTVSLYEATSQNHSLLKQVEIENGVDLYDGNNTLQIDVLDDKITIGIGRKKTNTVIVCENTKVYKTNRVGIVARPGSNVILSRAICNFEQSPDTPFRTKWDKQKLDEHFSQSINPIEGYWQYLDRDMEDNILRLGGKYSIAIVEKTKSKYDIIYCDGAQVNKQGWSPFMLKGELESTIFNGIYTGMWIDAMFDRITDDVQVSIENGVILTIKFPALKSQLRFSKVLNTGH